MSSHRSLHEIFLSNGDKVIHKWLHYFDIYERHFAKYVGKAPTMLEIGVFKGGSLSMWKEYFGDGAKLIGLDIDPECAQYAAEDIEIVIGSQDDPAVLNDICKRYDIDIVLDDGSHMMPHLNKTFSELFDKISPEGTYMLEDLHTCYMHRFEGGLGREGSFLETVKDYIDQLHAVYIPGMAPNAITKSTASINIYDSIVVFEKSPQGARRAIQTGAMDLLSSQFAR